MTTSTEWGASTVLSPEDAFAVLGDDTRFEILQALGEADGPVAYSDLFERIGYDDLSNFSYHLDKLVGHFINKTDVGYVLRRPGERVLEAVLSGAVTTDPVRELTRTEKPCPFCSGSIEVGYEQERVTMHCPECPGLFGQADSEDGRFSESGNLGYRPLPPAAVAGRTTAEIHDVSKVWTALTMHAVGRGVCPRCSGTVDHAVDVCESHDTSEEVCDRCGRRFGAMAAATCANCIFHIQPGIAAYLGTHTEVMAFLLDHGVDPVAPEAFHPYETVEETIVSTDPYSARYTFTVDDESITLTVDEDLSVIDITRDPVAETEC
jgi:DNA-binding transcriptional ArsR family regulator/ribosomal protein L37E